MNRIVVTTHTNGRHVAYDGATVIASSYDDLRHVWSEAVDYFNDLDSALLVRQRHRSIAYGTELLYHTVAGRTPFSDYTCRYL